MRGRCETHDEDPRIRVSESRNGPAPIVPISERGPLRAGDGLPIPYEPGTLPAGSDLGGEPKERISDHGRA
jgi:hypothetical protein